MEAETAAGTMAATMATVILAATVDVATNSAEATGDAQA